MCDPDPQTAPGSAGSNHRGGPYDNKKHHDQLEDVKRVGWFSKCQRLCKAVMDSNWGTARDLADEYYAGKEKR